MAPSTHVPPLPRWRDDRHGSQFLLDTGRAKVLIDCGMFQGSPNEAVRNRVPFAFEPSELDAVVLTHAHLDHCGLLPVLVREGFSGPIYCTATAELAGLVILDSGKLHEQFAKREARWERRNPDRVAADDRAEAERRTGKRWPRHRRRRDDQRGDRGGRRSRGARIRKSPCVPRAGRRDRSRPAAVHQGRRRGGAATVQDTAYDRELEVAPGVYATFLDAGYIAARRSSGSGRGGRRSSERVIVVSATSVARTRRSSATRPSSRPRTTS